MAKYTNPKFLSLFHKIEPDCKTTDGKCPKEVNFNDAMFWLSTLVSSSLDTTLISEVIEEARQYSTHSDIGIKCTVVDVLGSIIASAFDHKMPSSVTLKISALSILKTLKNDPNESVKACATSQLKVFKKVGNGFDSIEITEIREDLDVSVIGQDSTPHFLSETGDH